MAMSALEPKSYPVYVLSYVPLTVLHNGCCPGHILESTKGIETWFIDMTVRGSTVRKKQSFHLYLTYFSLFFFHKCCLSWPYLGKYKRD